MPIFNYQMYTTQTTVINDKNNSTVDFNEYESYPMNLFMAVGRQLGRGGGSKMNLIKKV